MNSFRLDIFCNNDRIYVLPEVSGVSNNKASFVPENKRLFKKISLLKYEEHHVD